MLISGPPILAALLFLRYALEYIAGEPEKAERFGNEFFERIIPVCSLPSFTASRQKFVKLKVSEFN